MGVLFMLSGLDGTKTGLHTVLSENHDPNARVPGADVSEQVPLFPVPMMDDDADDAKQDGGKRGAGRPAGSKNRSTEEWRNYLFARYRSPLIGMAEIANRDVLELARELRFETDTRKAKPEELLELLKVQLACRDKLAPYLHSKMPMAIEAGEHGLINLTIGGAIVGPSNAKSDSAFDVEFITIGGDEKNPANPQKTEGEKQNSVVSDSVVLSESAENKDVEGKKQTDLESVDDVANAGGV